MEQQDVYKIYPDKKDYTKEECLKEMIKHCQTDRLKLKSIEYEITCNGDLWAILNPVSNFTVRTVLIDNEDQNNENKEVLEDSLNSLEDVIDCLRGTSSDFALDENEEAMSTVATNRKLAEMYIYNGSLELTYKVDLPSLVGAQKENYLSELITEVEKMTQDHIPYTQIQLQQELDKLVKEQTHHASLSR